MTAKHKRKARAHPAASDAVSPVYMEAKKNEVRRDIWFSFTISIAIAIFLVGVNWSVEKWGIGPRIESMTYDLLQNHLTAPVNLPVIVLNISEIHMVPALGSHPQLVTDRQPLREIVGSLVRMKDENKDDGPAAIGLDVDFSPDEHGYAYPDDPQTLTFFLHENSTIPIRVGVNSSLALGPHKWLVNPDYFPLATCVVVPNPDPYQSTRYMPQFLNVKYRPSFNAEPEPCKSMGVDLADQKLKRDPPTSGWFLESIRPKDEDTAVSKSEFLVDYSPLDRLVQSALQVSNAEDVAKPLVRNSVKGKIVLLGRSENTTDTFTVPGRPQKVYAGVFLHACAAYTWLNRPLYELRPYARILLDLAFAFLIFGFLCGFRLLRLKQGKEVVIGHVLPALLTLGVAALLSIVATYYVDKTRLMWDDFILVDLALLVHIPIEQNTEEFIKRRVDSMCARWPGASAGSRTHPEGES